MALHQERFFETPLLPRQVVEKIQLRGLPISIPGLIGFLELASKHNPPQNLAEHLVDAMDYYDPTTFYADLDKATDFARKTVGSNPYNFVATSDSGSEYWIYQQMVKRGLPAATGVFIEYKHYDDKAINSTTLLHPHHRKNRETELYWLPRLIVDDISISGDTVSKQLYDPNSSDMQLPKQHIVVLRATRSASKHLQAFANMSFSGKRILSLKEALSHEVYSLIDYMMKMSRRSIPHIFNPSFFWSWYKVPDNLPRIFTDHESLPPIVDKSKFQPPYRPLTT